LEIGGGDQELPLQMKKDTPVRQKTFIGTITFGGVLVGGRGKKTWELKKLTFFTHTIFHEKKIG